MPTRQQLNLVHFGAEKVGLIVGKDKARYRLLLRNVGGVESSKDLDNVGLEDVMAVIEDKGFTGHPGGPHYWRDKVRLRGTSAGARVVRLIRALAEGSRYPVEAMVAKASHGRTDEPERLTPREAWKLIEGLKAIHKREGGAAAKDATAGRATHTDVAQGTDAPSLFSPGGAPPVSSVPEEACPF